MAKVYETPNDLHRDVLVKNIKDAKLEANSQFNTTGASLLIGGLAHMVHDAQLHMPNIPESKLWKIYGNRDSLTPKVFKWGGYGVAIISLVKGFIKKHDQKMAEKELAILGPIQEIIVREGSEADTKLHEEKSCKQAPTIIQSATAQVDRMQTPTANLSNSL